MYKEEENMDWEKEAPQLAAISKKNSFCVPDNYFENLSEQINNQILIEKIIAKDLVFKTPTAYFESLESLLLSKITIDKKAEALSRNNYGFIVPENYFEQSKQKINQTYINTSKTKTLPLNFIKFAAAACILMTTSLGIYFNIQKNTSINYQLSHVSNEEIETYLNQNLESNDVNVIYENLESKPVFKIEEHQISNKEINNYLDSTY